MSNIAFTFRENTTVSFLINLHSVIWSVSLKSSIECCSSTSNHSLTVCKPYLVDYSPSNYPIASLPHVSHLIWPGDVERCLQSHECTERWWHDYSHSAPASTTSVYTSIIIIIIIVFASNGSLHYTTSFHVCRCLLASSFWYCCKQGVT